MVNLLGRRGGPTAVPRFDARTLERIAVRLAIVFGLARSGGLTRVGRAIDGLAPLLEELDVAPSRLTAEDLLEALDGLRDEALASAMPEARDDGAPPAALPAEREGLARDGGFLVHRPGRSLSTGEAEIASRGYFDAVDRPPIATWLGVLDATSEGVEAGVWIAAWVEPGEVERARAGCRACPSGALAWLEDVSPPAAEDLMACARAAVGSRRR